jgi:NAD(P)-dependent dehydrogenase (short-subunit alcohol dehydrogenase family)
VSGRLDKRAVLITGASSGIGRASCVRAAAEGARVVLVARDHDRLEETRASLTSDVHHITRVCDVTDEAEVTKLADELRNEVGTLRGLVHCAGIHWLRPLQVTDTAALTLMLTSHVVSSAVLVRALVGRRLADREGCSVVLLASAAALQGVAGAAAYAAAKGAMVSLARTLAVELARRRVRVNAIAPGVVRTPQSAAFLSTLTPKQVQAITDDHPLGLGEPADVAGVVAFLLSDDARWVTGTTVVADGGLTAH